MKPPIFIIGCPRSGTSLLRRILNSHSQIAIPSESAFFVQLARVVEIDRAFKGLENMGFTKDDVLRQMKAFTAYFFETYAKSKNKPRWGDKTPHYLNHIETLDEMFDGEVQYVGIVRNGLDVAYSLCEFDWSILQPYLDAGLSKPEAAMKLWVDQNEKLLSFQARQSSRFQLIKYETLTESPDETLKPVFEFLGESWEDSVIDFQKQQHDEGFEDPKIKSTQGIQVNSGRYRQWSSDTIQKVYSIGKPMMESFGYQSEEVEEVRDV